MVRPEGVEFAGGGAATGLQVMSVPAMREALIQLPVTAWPLGRIVAVQETGIRSGHQDNQAIESKRNELRQMLESLEIAVNWWPSA